MAAIDADCPEAVDWDLLIRDVEGLMYGERAPAPPRRTVSSDNITFSPAEDEDPYMQHRDAIRGCATVQRLRNIEGGFNGNCFGGVGREGTVLGRRLVIVVGTLLFGAETEQEEEAMRIEEARRIAHADDASQGGSQSNKPEGQEGEASKDVADDAGEGPSNSGAAGEGSSKSILKGVRHRLATLAALKKSKQTDQQQQTSTQHAGGNGGPPDSSNDELTGQPTTADQTKQGLKQRLRQAGLFSRASKRQQQDGQDSSESGKGKGKTEGEDVSAGLLVNQEQSAAPKPDENFADKPVRPAANLQRLHDISKPGHGPKPDDVPQLDALPQLDDLEQLFANYNTGQGLMGGNGGTQNTVPEPSPADTSPVESSAPAAAPPRIEMLRRMDVRLFLATARRTSAGRRFGNGGDGARGRRRWRQGEIWRTLGYLEDVEWGNFMIHHDYLYDDDEASTSTSSDEAGGGSLLHQAGMADARNPVQYTWVEDDMVDTVTWAVREILRVMVKLEVEHRIGY